MILDSRTPPLNDLLVLLFTMGFCLDRLGGVIDSFMLLCLYGWLKLFYRVSFSFALFFLLQALADIKGFFGGRRQDYS